MWRFLISKVLAEQNRAWWWFAQADMNHRRHAKVENRFQPPAAGGGTCW